MNRCAARLALARSSMPVARSLIPYTAPLNVGATRHASDYDWNLGVPGSRIRNPAPDKYYDPYPGMGVGWWSLMTFAFCSFFWSQWYDVSRSVNISIGIFGPNMPM